LTPFTHFEDTCLELSLEKFCVPPFLVRFDGSYIPVGVFSALVVKLLQGAWVLDRYSLSHSQIIHYRYFICAIGSLPKLPGVPHYIWYRRIVWDQWVLYGGL